MLNNVCYVELWYLPDIILYKQVRSKTDRLSDNEGSLNVHLNLNNSSHCNECQIYSRDIWKQKKLSGLFPHFHIDIYNRPTNSNRLLIKDMHSDLNAFTELKDQQILFIRPNNLKKKLSVCGIQNLNQSLKSCRGF